MTTDFADFTDRASESTTPAVDAASMEFHSESVAADANDLDELDLEAAYRRALAAVEAAEQEFGQALEDLADDAGDGAIASGAGVADELTETELAESAPSPPHQPSGESPSSVAPYANETPANDESGRRLHPRRIIEAALFVGGEPLTTRKLRTLLRDEFDADVIERLIDELNDEYENGNRPYEIRFGEGGFRLALRDEHERLRNRVFGQAPKEVRLSQEALEVLALVAYRQPLDRDEIESLGGKDPAGVLRHLIRRELVAIERDDHAPPRVCYRTTGRFLQVFGLASIDELPRAEDLEFK